MVVVAMILLGYTVAFRLPDPLFSDPYATVLESRGGRLLGATIASDGQWRFPPCDSVPYKIGHCLLVFEDRHFYRHPGVNPFSMLRAARQNIRAGRVVSGGSTITMQLVRLMRRGRPRTLLEKCVEIVLATKLEIRYSKEEILALYASHAPFGGNVVGIDAAAWRYFGRPAHLLSWGEAASLAVLPNSPSLVYPGKNEALLRKKRDLVLQRLRDHAILEDDAARLASLEQIPGKPNRLPRRAPRLLTRAIRDGMVGERIRTSIDAELQEAVQQQVVRHQRKMAGNKVYNAAAVVIDIGTGCARAYVGNVDSEGDHSQHTDLVVAQRSTGSLLKPFLYALSVQRGMILPGQLLPDIPMYYRGFAPKNFDEKFHGAVPADHALSRSLNVPFVHLLREYSYERFYYDLRALGYKSMIHPPGHYGLTMILGGSESSLWELTALYAGAARVLQHYNTSRGPMRYREQEFYDNRYLKDALQEPGEEVVRGPLDAGAAWLMLRAMQQLRRPEDHSGWRNFQSSRAFAWKTGTSYGFRDAWAIGLNEQYAVGVWIGNADGEGRAGLTGVRSAAPLMFDVFSLLSGGAQWSRPVAAMRGIAVCTASGYRAGDDCTGRKTVFIPKGVTKTPFCHHHRRVHLDSTMQYQVNSTCFPVSKIRNKRWFVLPPVQAWYYKQYNPSYRDLPDYFPGCADDTGERFVAMIYPRRFTRIFVPRELDGSAGRTVFEAAHRNPGAVLYWYMDQEYIGSTRGMHQMGLAPDRGVHRLEVYDRQGREASAVFEVINRPGDPH